MGMQPDISVAVFINVLDAVAVHLVSIAPAYFEVAERISVEFGKSVPGSKPHEPFPVLYDVGNTELRQTVVGRIVFEMTYRQR